MPDRLEQMIHRYADAVEDTLVLPTPALIPARRGSPRWLAAAALVALVVALTVTVARRESTTVESAGTTERGEWQWTATAPPPVQLPTNLVSVWTGTEVLVFGGSTMAVSDAENSNVDSDGLPLQVGDARVGLAYDPTDDHWRELDAPPPGLVPGTAVWADDRLLAATRTAIAEYVPDSDSWRSLPLPLPAEAILWPPVTSWSGERFLVWAFEERRHELPAHLFAYQPSNGDIDELDPGPLTYRHGSSAVTDPEGFTLVGGAGDEVQSSNSLDVARFDSQTQMWTELPAGPLPDIAQPIVVPVGGELVVFGGHVAGRSNIRAGALTSATGEWRALTDTPATVGLAGNGLAIWVGNEIVVADSASNTDGEGSGALDPLTGEWRNLPEIPGGAACGSSGVWTGREIIILGGSIGCEEVTKARPTAYTMAVPIASDDE